MSCISTFGRDRSRRPRGDGSIGAATGRGSRCYVTLLKLKDGRFIDRDGSKGPKATVGRGAGSSSAPRTPRQEAARSSP